MSVRMRIVLVESTGILFAEIEFICESSANRMSELLGPIIAH
jgi:hypothetical protein